ncbi:MAG: alpha/beta fold hydrolase [Anaerolineales bacterium]|nr:alpha/beta fold hydrolase [Anaerolineales bacterium]
MQACLDSYQAQGIDLSAYNSVENAEDVNSIRETLGYDKIFYYGESYGTLLGQYLLRSHPEILDGIILDGIAPATAARWTDVTNIPESFGRVFNACAADEACNALYPDLEAKLAKAMAALKANPASFTLSDGKGGGVDLKVDDTLAMNALFLNLYLSGGFASIPDIVTKLSEGDYTPLNATIPFYFANSSVARGMHLAIACSDDPVGSVDDLNLDVADAYKALILDDADSYLTACPMLGVPHMPDSSDELVKSDVPALLLQGGLDPATPVEGGNNVQTGLPNSYNIVVPAGSHIQSNSDCILNIMAAFMADPRAEPDTSCIDQSIKFALPQTVTIKNPDTGTAISMDLPAGFVPAGDNAWYNGQYQVYLFAFDSAKSVDQVAEESAAPLPVKLDVTDGPVIAGYPTKAVIGDLEVQGKRIGVNIYAFGDDKGVYKIVFNLADSAQIEAFRAKDVPALLETVKVGGQ